MAVLTAAVSFPTFLAGKGNSRGHGSPMKRLGLKWKRQDKKASASRVLHSVIG